MVGIPFLRITLWAFLSLNNMVRILEPRTDATGKKRLATIAQCNTATHMENVPHCCAERD